jgi:hypothetical protein
MVQGAVQYGGSVSPVAAQINVPGLGMQQIRWTPVKEYR